MDHDFILKSELIDLNNEEFKNKTEQLITERIDETKIFKAFEMALKLGKVKLLETCLEILNTRRFKDIIYQKDKFNKLSEQSFQRILEAHEEQKKNAQDQSQYLQSKNIGGVIRDYFEENYEEESTRKQKISHFLDLFLTANPEQSETNFEEFYGETYFHDEKFLKSHLAFFQAHILKLDKQNQFLIKENLGLKEQVDDFKTQQQKQNDVMIESLDLIKKILFENSEKIDKIKIDVVDEVNRLNGELTKVTDKVNIEVKEVMNNSKNEIKEEIEQGLKKEIEDLEVKVNDMKGELKHEIETKFNSELKNSMEEKEDITMMKANLKEELDKAKISIGEEIKIARDEIKQEISQITDRLKIGQQNDLSEMVKSLPKSNLLKDFLCGDKSSLITQYDMEKLKEWIPKPEQSITNCLRMKLIFRGSRDGFGSEIFHNKCNNIFPTLSVIKSEYGKIFGGYTTATWEGVGVDKNDPNSFLFSFTNEDKYPYNGNGRAIHANKSHLTVYGGGTDLFLFTNCNTSSNSGCSFTKSYSCTKYSSQSSESSAYFAGGTAFKVEEVEVYKVIWD